MVIITNHVRPNVGIAWITNHVTKKTELARWVVISISWHLYAKVCMTVYAILYANHSFSIGHLYFLIEEIILWYLTWLWMHNMHYRVIKQYMHIFKFLGSSFFFIENTFVISLVFNENVAGVGWGGDWQGNF